MRTFSGLRITGAAPQLRRNLYYLTHMLLAMERAPLDAQLRVNLVSLQHMRQLNRDYKGVDQPTDVLTFTPAGAADSFVNDLLFGDEDEGGDRPAHGGQFEECSPSAPSSSAIRAELVDLGDIFVSLEYMQKRCHTSPSRSLPLVPYLQAAMVHATLHALGYDHTTPAELRKMVRREQQLGCRLAMLCRQHPEYFPPLDVWELQYKNRK